MTSLTRTSAWDAIAISARSLLTWCTFRTRSPRFTHAYSRVALAPGIFLLKFLRGKPWERDCSPHNKQENHTHRFDLFRFIKRFYSEHSSCVPWSTSQLRGKGIADLLLYSKSYRFASRHQHYRNYYTGGEFLYAQVRNVKQNYGWAATSSCYIVLPS